MKVRRRVRSLFWKSTYRRAWAGWERSIEMEGLLRRPEIVEVDALRRRLFPDPGELPDRAPWKYLDVRRSLRANLKRAAALGLFEECAPPGSQSVLDLGCGAGFFLFLCRLRGYDAWGLDVGDVPLYDEITRILGVRRVLARIEAFEDLPALPCDFDTITAFGTVFNRRKDGPWQGVEWAYLLRDLERFLKPGGRIYLEPNPLTTRKEQGARRRILPKQVHRYFLERGARVDAHSVLFPPYAPTGLAAPTLPVPASSAPVAAAPARCSTPRQPKRGGFAGAGRVVRRSLAAAAATAVLLMSAELAVRAFAPQEMRLRWYSREGVMVLMPGYRGSAGTAGTQPASYVEINSDGLRDREYARAKDPDTFRILVLGDAITTGLQVPAEATYPKRLESLLAAVHPRGRTEVVNASIPGYGTADELRYLQSFGERWKPDLVVLAFYGGNDVANNLEEGGLRRVGDRVRVERPRLAEWRYRVKAARSWLAAHSHLYHFLHASESPSATADRRPTPLDPATDRAGLRLTWELVKEVDDVTRRLGARPVLVTIPDPASVAPTRHAVPLLQQASASGIPSLDLASPLLAEGEPSPSLWERDRYLTSRGHERAAEAIAAYLVNERLIPS